MRPVLIFFLLIVLSVHAQKQYAPSKYKYKGKEYFVYPFRMSDERDVPPCAFKLPDGDYIIFHDYVFRQKNYFAKAKLTDSLLISAFFNLKNNLPEGPALFYGYFSKGYNSVSKKKKWVTTGYFENGLQHGQWTTKDRSRRAKEVNFYHKGLKNGLSEIYFNGKIAERTKYRNDTLTDTVYRYNKGRLISVYDVYPDNNAGFHYSFYNKIMAERVEKEWMMSRVKSFYRAYDRNGCVTASIRFRNGEVIAIDTFTMAGDMFTVTETDSNIHVIKQINVPKGRLPAEDYYVGNTLVRKKGYEWWKDYFDARLYEYPEEAAHPLSDSVIMSVDYIGRNGRKWKEEYHFMPWYRFTYSVIKENKAADTLRSPIYSKTDKCGLLFLDTVSYGLLTLATENKVYASDSCSGKTADIDRRFDAFTYNAYEEKNRKRESYFGPLAAHLSWYEYTTVKQTFLNDGVPFTGKMYSAPDLLNTVDRYGVKFARDYLNYDLPGNSIIMQEFLNGTLNGLKQELSVSDKSYIPYYVRDLKDYFFKHPEWCHAYRELTISNGRLNGVMRFYAVGDELSEENDYEYQYTDEFEDVPHLSVEATYVNDSLDGEYRVFFPDGTLKRRAFFKKGKLHGREASWLRAGVLKSESEYIDGKLHGTSRRYVDSVLTETVDYFDGLVNGEVVHYDRATKLPFLKMKVKRDTVTERTIYFLKSIAAKEHVVFSSDKAVLFDARIDNANSILEMRGPAYSEDAVNGMVKQYYEDGTVMAEGKMVNNDVAGEWKFYNVNNTLIYNVSFADTFMTFTGRNEKIKFVGEATAYYNNGKIRGKGRVRYFDQSYDCNTKQDKADFDIYFSEFYTYHGKQIVANGKGYLVNTDENGVKISEGELENSLEEGVWKFYDPNGKLKSIGKFINGKREGLWFEGRNEL